ncbi:ANKRD50 [Symbiodinium natans]|uniref:ANKRD50 protein n=1 Tax=Symbiodinium natans TaxID=878477 RepID=A0A812KNL5_9DINO|nr:ANKRD50 [Symbiodinium natans]
MAEVQTRNRQLELQVLELQNTCSQQAHELVVQRESLQKLYAEEAQVEVERIQELRDTACASAHHHATSKTEELTRAEVQLDKQQLELVAKANDVARLREELHVSHNERSQLDLHLLRVEAREEQTVNELEEVSQLCRQRGAMASNFEAQLDLSELKLDELQKSCSHQLQELSAQRRLTSSLQLQLEDELRQHRASPPIELLEVTQAQALEIQQLRAEVGVSVSHAAAQNEVRAEAEAEACQMLRGELAEEKARGLLTATPAAASSPLATAALAGAAVTADGHKLFEAAAQGDVALASALEKLPMSEFMAVRSADGSTLLHAAAAGGSLPAALAALLAGGARRRCEQDLQRDLLRHEHLSFVNARDCEQRSALLCHCQSANTCAASAATLLESQANPFLEDGHGCTPFLACASRGNCEVMKLLLRATGGSVLRDSDENGRTALHCATLKGNADAVRLLLQVSADVELPDAAGRRAVELAEAGGHEDIVKLLEPAEEEPQEIPAVGLQSWLPREENADEEEPHQDSRPVKPNAPATPTSPTSPDKYAEEPGDEW